MTLMEAARLLALITPLVATGDEGGGAQPPPWHVAARDSGITVYSRAHPGGALEELKAEGLIHAPPPKVWSAIRDYPNYRSNMPYTEESRVLSTEEGGKVILFYSVVNAPLVSRRDYVIRILDRSTWKDGQGYFQADWNAAEAGPPVRPNVIRVTRNEGYWRLAPRDGGKTTWATYYIFTDPGGQLPQFVVNKANGTAVPNVFKAIQKRVEKP